MATLIERSGFIFVILALLSSPVNAAKRVALIIGNDNYATLPRLNNAVKDASDMASKLGALGFEVILKKNASRRDFSRALSEFGGKLSSAEAGLVFYAGHGVQADGVNYLIPSNSQIEIEEDLRLEAVAANEFLKTLKAGGADISLLILDACRDNPLPERSRSALRGLAVSHVSSGPGGIAMLYSAGPGETAADGPAGGNGVFTGELLKALDQPGLKLEDVFKKTIKRVNKKTNGKQTPWMNTSLIGDFYFKPAASKPKPHAQDTDKSLELAFWDSIKNSNDPALYQAYLKKYPKGHFVDLAKIKAKPATTNTTSLALAVEKPEVTGLISLKVTTEPQDARIRILNIEPKFYQGIRLKPGRYKIEVSKTGFEPNVRWFDLSAKQRDYQVTLNKIHQRRPFEPEMVTIPGGRFLMGSADEYAERPVNLVNISTFKMAKHEVTIDQFRHFILATNYSTDAENNVGEEDGCNVLRFTLLRGGPYYKIDYFNDEGALWRKPGFNQSRKHPVVCVSWNDARAYIKWINLKTGRTYRLPSEAEWEYAARAGGDEKYHFVNKGDGVCKYGNVADWKLRYRKSAWDKFNCYDGVLFTSPVGSYAPNAFGLKDIIGNVMEWVEDCDDVNYAPTNGGAWKRGDCNRRIKRGSSWYSGPDYQNVTREVEKTWRSSRLGFRLAQDFK